MVKTLTLPVSFAKNGHFLPVKLMFKYNVIVFQLLNTNKAKLCCPRYLLGIFKLKEIHHDRLRGSKDFFILKSTQNNNIMVASMVNYWNNLDHSLTYVPDLLNFRKLLKTHHFKLAYEHG